MRMMNPYVMVLDWISWFWNLRWLELCFVDSPRVFGNICEFIGRRGGAGGHRGGHNPPGRAWAPRRALVGCAPLGAPLRYFLGPLDVFWSKKIPQKVSLHLGSV